MTTLVIGGGPAGLMAAEELGRAGHRVIVADAKPSLGRKFLMAGKSGLNLTKIEDRTRFRAAYAEAAGPLSPMLDAFGPQEVCAWAEGLGEDLFTGSTGRVFPKVMKASPLLRAWLARLDALGVEARRNWRWTGWSGGDVLFTTPEGPRRLKPAVTVLALGGASWARLGSDGAWTAHLKALGVPLTPFAPANCGFRVSWSPPMAKFFGHPVKGAALKVGGEVSRGEWIVSQKGIEGGGVYAISRALRGGLPLEIDLFPERSAESLSERLSRPRGKASLTAFLRKALRLDGVRLALAYEGHDGLSGDAGTLAAQLKSVPLKIEGPRPMDEAISTAGGVAWHGVDEDLRLRVRPDTFVAGEMLDWEAPTGGYLLTACLATGRWAGRAAAAQVA